MRQKPDDEQALRVDVNRKHEPVGMRFADARQEADAGGEECSMVEPAGSTEAVAA